MKIKETIQEAAERVYDVVKDNKYHVVVHLFDKKQAKKVRLATNRSTNHTKKWRAKNH